MKCLIVGIVCIVASLSLSAQKIIISGVEGNRPLVWKDFTGKPDKSSSFFAYTAWTSKTKFGGVRFEGDKAIVNNFELTLELDPKNSWHKEDKISDELLKHEQGHFDIGRLYMKEVLQKVATTPLSKAGFQQELQKLMKEANQKYHEMNLQYDRETGHSRNKEEQAKWNAFFAKELE